MSSVDRSQLRAGYLYATIAYLGWGFFPIYWKFLRQLPSLEILCHRIIWAFIFYTLIMLWRDKAWSIFWPRDKKLRRNLLLAAVLLMGNWFVYIYAVNSNQIVESSLGYFINPLVNIAIGVWVLKERLSGLQKFATACAAAGVLVISLDQGHLPWIALFLAFSFSFYGLIKKLNPAPGLQTNQFESLVLLPVAVSVLLFQQKFFGAPPFPFGGSADIFTGLLLIGSGLITGLPLVFFAEAAQRLPFYLLGFFQFLAPSLQFLTGVLMFGEALSPMKLMGFVFIWVAGCMILLNNSFSGSFGRAK